jgi:putative oxidoreductase
MDLGLLVVRVIVGVLFFGHGAQKLFGWYGGYGLEGTGGFFEQLGFPKGKLQAAFAGLAEAGGGILFALGLLTPLALVLLSSVMLVAVIKAHLSKGIWASNGGYEYNLVLVATVFAVTGVGAGKWSLDHALSLNVAGTGWALGALGVGLLGGVLALAQTRLAPSRTQPTEPTPA